MGIWRSELAGGIRKHGFQKWYERELMASHAHLVLTFLCMVGLLAAFEVYDRSAAVADQVQVAVSVLACGAIGVWALRRYLYLLLHAETTANQAVCTQCAVYARFDVAPPAPAEPNKPPAPDAVRVCCRGCGHHWSIWR